MPKNEHPQTSTEENRYTIWYYHQADTQSFPPILEETEKEFSTFLNTNKAELKNAEKNSNIFDYLYYEKGTEYTCNFLGTIFEAGADLSECHKKKILNILNGSQAVSLAEKIIDLNFLSDLFEDYQDASIINIVSDYRLFDHTGKQIIYLNTLKLAAENFYVKRSSINLIASLVFLLGELTNKDLDELDEYTLERIWSVLSGNTAYAMKPHCKKLKNKAILYVMEAYKRKYPYSFLDTYKKMNQSDSLLQALIDNNIEIFKELCGEIQTGHHDDMIKNVSQIIEITIEKCLINFIKIISKTPRLMINIEEEVRNKLITFIESKDVELTTKLTIEFDSFKNQGDTQGNTVLHIAAKYATPAEFKIFLAENESLLTALNHAGQDPLMVAIKYNNFALVNELLTSKLSETQKGDETSQELIHLNARKHNEKINACWGKLNEKLKYRNEKKLSVASIMELLKIEHYRADPELIKADVIFKLLSKNDHVDVLKRIPYLLFSKLTIVFDAMKDGNVTPKLANLLAIKGIKRGILFFCDTPEDDYFQKATLYARLLGLSSSDPEILLQNQKVQKIFHGINYLLFTYYLSITKKEDTYDLYLLFLKYSPKTEHSFLQKIYKNCLLEWVISNDFPLSLQQIQVLAVKRGPFGFFPPTSLGIYNDYMGGKLDPYFVVSRQQEETRDNLKRHIYQDNK